MKRLLFLLILACLLGCPAVQAQQSSSSDEDRSSEQTEETDESFRRSRELEDARARDQTWADTSAISQPEPEKIDQLPKESRDHLRDQLIDVIVEDGEWEPSDALKDYPYEPSEAAQSDAELAQQEQEAWDEQIEKYHEREASAWGAQRGPVPGPGNPSGQQGGNQGQQGAQQGGGQQGQESGEQGQGGGQSGGQSGQGGAQSGSSEAGTYQPDSSSSEDETSTAGVSESALDFLRGRQNGSETSTPPQSQAETAPPAMPPSADQSAEQTQAAQQQAQAQASQSEETQPEETPEEEQAEPEETVELDTRGIIAIKDLDKLEGADQLPEDEEEGDDDS